MLRRADALCLLGGIGFALLSFGCRRQPPGDYNAYSRLFLRRVFKVGLVISLRVEKMRGKRK